MEVGRFRISEAAEICSAEHVIAEIAVDTAVTVLSDLSKLIEELPDSQKEVLRMRLFKDMSFKEIGDHTGVSINTALGRMRYAVINLRKMIEERNLIFTQ